MNDYEQRQEDRRQRYLDRAEKADKRSADAHRQVKAISDMIPFGQPILVGHHSEKRHRADIKRMDNGMRRAIAESDKSDHYQQKAESVGKAGISSDDPGAVVKLKEKLQGLVNGQSYMKQVNVAHKRYLKDPTSLEGSQLPEKAIFTIKNYVPAYSWEPHPFPPYAMSNGNANIANVKKRIAKLEAAADMVEAEPIQGEGFKIIESKEENRVLFDFDKKPSREVCQIMRRNGWKWNRRLVAWSRHLNQAGRYSSDRVTKQIEGML